MPELTRRRTWPDDQHASEDRSIFYGNMGVGRIRRHLGTAQVIWRWSVWFHPGRHPRDNITGNADSFERAREAWAKAWAKYLPECTEAQFDSIEEIAQTMSTSTNTPILIQRIVHLSVVRRA